MKDNKLPAGRYLRRCRGSLCAQPQLPAVTWLVGTLGDNLRLSPASKPPHAVLLHAVGGVTGTVPLEAVGMSCPALPRGIGHHAGCPGRAAIPGGVAGSGWRGRDHTPMLGPGGLQGMGGPKASALPPESRCSRSPSNIHISLRRRMSLRRHMSHRQRMTNSCPEASNVRHLDKYSSELTGKSRLRDRLQPFMCLQPSPPGHTPRGALCKRGLSRCPRAGSAWTLSPLAATLRCAHTRRGHSPRAHTLLPGSATSALHPSRVGPRVPMEGGSTMLEWGGHDAATRAGPCSLLQLQPLPPRKFKA